MYMDNSVKERVWIRVAVSVWVLLLIVSLFTVGRWYATKQATSAMDNGYIQVRVPVEYDTVWVPADWEPTDHTPEVTK